MAKVAYSKDIFFPSKLDINWRMKLVIFYTWSVDFHGVEKWTLRKIEQN